jgi:lipid A 3-O-deacylase
MRAGISATHPRKASARLPAAQKDIRHSRSEADIESGGSGLARQGRMRGILWTIVCSLMALPATAGEREAGGGFIHEIKIGAQVHDIPYMWSGFHKEPYGVDLNLEAQFSPHMVVWRGAIRPMIGATINFEGNTSKAYAGARWQWEQPSISTFIALGLAVAVHNGETFTSDPEAKQLGRRVLFHDSIEIGYRFDAHRSVSLFFEHISNASTADKNQGLDTLGIRYGYRF